MARLRVEIVSARPDRQDLVVLQVPAGTSAAEAVRQSGLEAGGLRLGIGGKVVPAARILRDGDRVELLRPLAADPKEARRQRARAARRR
jgi:putative ubiquitin-RnfH superfamily antitoxin RatB of RatAB toxin-antitoxin module